MAVRFLPPPEDRTPPNRDEGENLAEVVEMRSWLRPAPVEDAAGASIEADADTEALAEALADAEVPADAERAVSAPSPSGWGSRARGDQDPDHDDSVVAPVTRVRFGTPPAETSESFGDAEPDAIRVPKAKAKARASVQFQASCERSETGGESTRSEAYEDAVRLLARRARSSGELRDDLLALDHSADDVSIVIDEFIESHYLDDIGLARVQSEKLRESKGASRGQIARKLRERKLPDAVVEEILGELDVDEEYALLREAAVKRAERLTGLDRPTAQRRLLGFLARRGWSGEPAMRAVNEALDGGLGRGRRGPSGVRFE